MSFKQRRGLPRIDGWEATGTSSPVGLTSMLLRTPRRFINPSTNKMLDFVF